NGSGRRSGWARNVSGVRLADGPPGGDGRKANDSLPRPRCSSRYLPVSVVPPSVRRAIGWAVYLESHARRAYGSVTAAEADTARAIVARIQSGDLKGDFLESHARRAYGSVTAAEADTARAIVA